MTGNCSICSSGYSLDTNNKCNECPINTFNNGNSTKLNHVIQELGWKKKRKQEQQQSSSTLSSHRNNKMKIKLSNDDDFDENESEDDKQVIITINITNNNNMKHSQHSIIVKSTIT